MTAKVNIYELEAKCEEIEFFLVGLQEYLAGEGFEKKVHLHEPRQQEEIFEFTKNEEILSIEIDRRSMDLSIFRMSSSEIDPHAVVVEVLSRLCADLVATFVQPVAGRANCEELCGLFGRHIDELIARLRKG